MPVNRSWTDTGITLQEGEAVTVVARGELIPEPVSRRATSVDKTVGPKGTFFYKHQHLHRDFPLPSGDRGPAPSFCLIGRIADGPVFYVGPFMSWTADRGGRLWLGINDFDVSDNVGRFTVRVTKPDSVQPIAFEKVLSDIPVRSGRAQPGARVVVFYIDGLRPDVVREMTAMGHLPNIRKLFVDGGTWMQHCFTGFPSDTITSNGTMWTGCFSDRHGIKGQVRFSRRRLVSESYLDPLGPSRSARLLAPRGIDKIMHHTQAAVRKLVQGADASQRWAATQTTGVPPIYAYLQSQGSDWATGVLPVMTEIPPLLWTRSLARHLPYFHAHRAWRHIDDANSHYVARHLLNRNSPVTVLWLPETDSCSHKHGRGQFGETRRTVAQADKLIGDVVKELETHRQLENTYLVLVSDHGHVGGRDSHLKHYDIAHQLFFRPREVTPDRRWLGGGLGLSVKLHRSWSRHRGDDARSFVFIDGDSDGAARIFLPNGRYDSEDWSGPNPPGNLLAYQIAGHLPPVNLPQTLAAGRPVPAAGRQIGSVTQVSHSTSNVESAVDLVLMKLTPQSILITTSDRGQAVIARKRNAEGEWVYTYRPVEDVLPTPDGEVSFHPIEYPQTDPLGLLKYLPPHVFDYEFDEQDWLRITALTEYPDSVVAMTRHMLWQDNLKFREAEFAPDLVVTARKGWFFGTKSSPGTMHGYPLADAMRASLYFSGPNIRQGTRIDEPCRLTDLTPTILHMVGASVDAAQFDGRVLDHMFEPASTAVQQVGYAVVGRPVFWNEVDLNAWHALKYDPQPEFAERPWTVNHPSSPFDLNNIVYNALTVPEWNVFRLADDAFSPLTGGRRTIVESVEKMDWHLRHHRLRWVAEGAKALNIPEAAPGDYSPYSLGNLQRASSAIDWSQDRGQVVDRYLLQQTGRSRSPGSKLFHRVIDGTQFGFWETYRFAQRVIMETLDEKIINGLENRTDHAINAYRRTPAEVIVRDAMSE